MHALLKLKPFVVIAVAFGYTFLFFCTSRTTVKCWEFRAFDYLIAQVNKLH